MTRKRYEDLTRAGRNRVVTATLLRAVASAALLVLVYYLAPLDAALDTYTLVWFVFALVLVGAVIAWQVRAILRSDVPRLRAIQAVAIGLPMLLLVFAAVYVVIATDRPDSFTEPLSRTDALYFTLTVFTTVGFGDIAPKSDLARIITMTQMIVGLIAVGLGARILISTVRIAVAQRNRAGPLGPTTPDHTDARQPDPSSDSDAAGGG
ncbi:MAG: voltage-gated potassium channel [Pseudonocardiales bacterium]|jgi:voltage-gated potassium channel|nr:Ion transport 2 domain protein [Pseudonocardia sp.]MDT7649958.1 voltage-gated potassium channel [Pseudonocardiales bacterium]